MSPSSTGYPKYFVQLYFSKFQTYILSEVFIFVFILETELETVCWEMESTLKSEGALVSWGETVLKSPKLGLY